MKYSRRHGITVERPVSFWIEKERLNSRIVDCLTVILRTKGCSWRKCLMCGFSREFAEEAGEKELKKQLDYALSHKKPDVLKIFTSGSFFDNREVPVEFRKYTYRKIEELGISKLIVESRPEYVFNCDCLNMNFDVEVGIGLETSNDFIRENCVNKGFKFSDYVKAAEFLTKNSINVRTYLLLKPPFLSEKEAIYDCLKSIEMCEKYSNTISINPVYVPKKTYLEKLWKAKLYRPPWLWSVIEVLRGGAKITERDIICDPVGAGSNRASHNCGVCDKPVAKAIKDFSLYQDVGILEDLSCECIDMWEKYKEYEHIARFDFVSYYLK
jgi:radical SAM enzyme (TIGR01210 family)